MDTIRRRWEDKTGVVIRSSLSAYHYFAHHYFVPVLRNPSRIFAWFIGRMQELSLCCLLQNGCTIRDRFESQKKSTQASARALISIRRTNENLGDSISDVHFRIRHAALCRRPKHFGKNNNPFIE